MKRRVVTLRNAEGHSLHCVLEEPEESLRPGWFAVLLCPGVKTRTGSHRLYRKLAPAFLRRGIPVMRVDFRGLGDSEGAWPDDRLEAIYHAIELGACTGDARAALDWLEEHAGGRHFIVGGLCGAATTAVLLGASDWRVAALYAIGLPAVLHVKGTVQSVSMLRAEARYRCGEYLRKLFRPGSWMRLLSLRSDFRLMWRLALAGRRGPAQAPGLNPLLAPALLAMLTDRCPALLMYGERDRYRWGFEEKLLPWMRPALGAQAALLDQATIAGANHVLSDPSAVAEAVQVTGTWLDARFGEDRKAPPLRARAA